MPVVVLDPWLMLHFGSDSFCRGIESLVFESSPFLISFLRSSWRISENYYFSPPCSNFSRVPPSILFLAFSLCPRGTQIDALCVRCMISVEFWGLSLPVIESRVFEG